MQHPENYIPYILQINTLSNTLEDDLELTARKINRVYRFVFNAVNTSVSK